MREKEGPNRAVKSKNSGQKSADSSRAATRPTSRGSHLKKILNYFRPACPFSSAFCACLCVMGKTSMKIRIVRAGVGVNR